MVMEAVNTGKVEAKVVEGKLDYDLDAMNIWQWRLCMFMSSVKTWRHRCLIRGVCEE